MPVATAAWAATAIARQDGSASAARAAHLPRHAAASAGRLADADDPAGSGAVRLHHRSSADAGVLHLGARGAGHPAAVDCHHPTSAVDDAHCRNDHRDRHAADAAAGGSRNTGGCSRSSPANSHSRRNRRSHRTTRSHSCRRSHRSSRPDTSTHSWDCRCNSRPARCRRHSRTWRSRRARPGRWRKSGNVSLVDPPVGTWLIGRQRGPKALNP